MRSRPRQRVQGCQCQLRLPARQLLFAAEPGVPAGHGPVESRRLDVLGEEQEFETVSERDFRELGGHRPREHEVPPLERTPELRVSGALGSHEHMFAWSERAASAGRSACTDGHSPQAGLPCGAMGKVIHLPPLGHYLANEVGRLAGVSGDQIGQWARYGYVRSSQSEDQPRVYSYQDVAEAMAVHQLRDSGVSYEDIRKALAELREDPELGDWPLSSADLGTAGATVVLLDFTEAYDLTGRPWHPLLDVGDLRRIAVDLNRGGWAARELPNLTHIEVNPERLSGRPTIRGRRVAARSVAELSLAGGHDVLVDEYGLDDDEIRDAEQWWEAASSYEAAA